MCNRGQRVKLNLTSLIAWLHLASWLVRLLFVSRRLVFEALGLVLLAEFGPRWKIIEEPCSMASLWRRFWSTIIFKSAVSSPAYAPSSDCTVFPGNQCSEPNEGIIAMETEIFPPDCPAGHRGTTDNSGSEHMPEAQLKLDIRPHILLALQERPAQDINQEARDSQRRHCQTCGPFILPHYAFLPFLH